MQKISRRSFVKQSVIMAGSISALNFQSASSYARVIGSNDRVRLAFSGVGSRARTLFRFFGEVNNIEHSYLVDPDMLRLGSAAELIEKTYGNKPKSHTDIRVMLEDKDIDAVVVAACDHWHSLMGIWCCQAGKDVYLEKPCSHRLFEGRKCVEAAEKYKRIVQHGTQRRSEIIWAKVAAAVQQEKYGKLTAVKVYCNRPRPPLPFKPEEVPPKTLDWDLWLGPSPSKPYTANYVPYNWHWFWDTGSGEICNNGVHYFDLCRWALKFKHPNSVISFGTRFVKDAKNHYKDQGQTPNIHILIYDVNGIPIICESCNIAGPKEKWPATETTEFYTEQGIIRGENFHPHQGPAVPVEVEYTPPHPGTNFANFIDCVRNQDKTKLNAPIEEGHYSASVSHWGNISYKLGKPESFDNIREAMGNNELLQKTIDNVLENVLGELKGISLKDIPFKLGPKLVIDGEKEKFVDNPEADKLLLREPRPPFAIPDVV